MKNGVNEENCNVCRKTVHKGTNLEPFFDELKRLAHLFMGYQ